MSDILYIPDLAKKLGRTESAIRMAIQDGRDTVPRHMKIGRRVCWTVEMYDKWLAKKVKNAELPQSLRKVSGL